MNQQGKAAVVKDLVDRLGRASMTLVSEYRGIDAVEATELRRGLRAVRGEMRVVKNTLIRRAVKDTPFDSLADKLGGPVGLILSFEDPVAVAKTVTSFKGLGEKLKIRGGLLDGKPLSAEQLRELASLPSKEVVLAQLLGLLSAPATRLVRVLNEPGSAIARLVDAIGKTKTTEAAA